MKTRFVVSMGVPPAQQSGFTEYLNQLRNIHGWGFGWWHWLPGVWLITDVSGNFTAASLRDAIQKMFPDTESVVLELRQDGTDTWAAFGPKPPKNMLTWLHENWTK
jgi:hypothetical protein